MKFITNKVYKYDLIAKIISSEIMENSYKIVGITGTSSVGKSTFTKMIRTQLEKAGHTVRIIRMDDYLKRKYRGKTQFWNRLDSTYLKPEFFNWEKIKNDIDILNKGKSVEKECYIRGIGWGNKKHIKPAEIIFVEGLFLDSVQAAEYMKYDLLVSLTAEDEFIRKLRTKRDAYYRKNYKNFKRTESETQKEIADTLQAGKSYTICYDKWKYLRLKVREGFRAIVELK